MNQSLERFPVGSLAPPASWFGRTWYCWVLGTLFLATFLNRAEVRLPLFFTKHPVMQRDKLVRFWPTTPKAATSATPKDCPPRPFGRVRGWELRSAEGFSLLSSEPAGSQEWCRMLPYLHTRFLKMG